MIANDAFDGAAPANVSNLSAAELKARWDAFLDARFAACEADAVSEIAAGRCQVTAIDNRGSLPSDSVDPITIEDLAAFRPIVGELVVEPDGWGVVGTPTNFYATAESHTMQGDLLGSAVTVRWTPTTYAFDYGDGTTQTTEGSGAAWSGTGEQWTETSTSHAYSSRDDVTASLTVTFTAEVDAGGGWFQVPGSLPVEAPAVPVKVFEVDTVLTAGDCAAAPTAPGCG
ncbi:hypothetical protein [Agrococcus terreus]|uniref:hypothetical protein n=1 Tax=Agrococcus terreus TaxID=574649 RepID=UPI00166A0F59|nr:hypothetical protein [Agrococcus terreus]